MNLVNENPEGIYTCIYSGCFFIENLVEV
uniref:Uncharacterized protein n=1 Tax=Rhizophora mucronata TaxID=61149 RepID=A0A2P2R0M6_RHIMU